MRVAPEIPNEIVTFAQNRDAEQPLKEEMMSPIQQINDNPSEIEMMTKNKPIHVKTDPAKKELRIQILKEILVTFCKFMLWSLSIASDILALISYGQNKQW